MRQNKSCIFRLLILCFIVFFPRFSFAQVSGDYGAVVSGPWGSASTWKVYDGVSWATSPFAVSTPTSTTNVFILSGSSVVTTSGPFACKDLNVNSGGKVYSNSQGSNVYIWIWGNITCDGFIGNTGQTTITGSSGTNTISVGSASGIALGMAISGTGILSGATVVNISGTTITLGNITNSVGTTITGSSGSTTVSVTNTSGMAVGMYGLGTGIAPGSTITSIAGSVSTTISGALGSTTITVGSNAGLALGMNVSGTGIGAGATITNIAGTTISLSVNNSATVSGTGSFLPTSTTVTMSANNTGAVSGNGFFMSAANNSSAVSGTGTFTLFDAISFGIEGPSCLATGTGLIDISRCRKNSTTNPVTNFTVDINFNLRFATGSQTQIYNDAGNTFFNITINAGKTMALTGGGGIVGNVSMDGLSGSDGAEKAGSYTINGTLIVSGTIYMTTDNSTKPCSFTIGSTGVVQTVGIIANSSGVAKHTLTMLSGGLLQISGALSGPPSGTFFLANNIYNLNPGSTIDYYGSGFQNVCSNITYANLKLSNTNTKSANGAIVATGNIDIAGSAVFLPSSTTPTITLGGNWTNYNTTGFSEGSNSILTFNGSVDQFLTVSTGGFEDYYKMVVNKSGGRVMLSSAPMTVVRISNNLNLVSGNIVTGPTNSLNYIQIQNTATVTGASDLSFVEGACARQLVSGSSIANFVFPIGKSAKYRPAAIAGTPSSNSFAFGEYYKVDPMTITGGVNITTAVSGSSGVNTITVVSTAGLGVGMTVYGTGIGTGAKITNITGSILTLSVANAAAVSGSGYFLNQAATLDHISRCEYWRLRIPSTQIFNVMLSWDTYSFCPLGVTNVSDLRVTCYDNRAGSTLWVDQGAGATTGSTAAGTIWTSDTVNFTSLQSVFGGASIGVPFTLASFTSNNPLPVNLLWFAAKANKKAVDINWVTGSEVNCQYFSVERAQDPKLFSEIDRVGGHGTTSSQNEYAILDNHPLPGLSYYRLREVDFDGNYQFSKTVAVNFADISEYRFFVYPNPSAERITFVPPPDFETLIVRLINTNGLIVKELSYSPNKSNAFEIDISDLTNGVYCVSLNSDRIHVSQTFVKQ